MATNDLTPTPPEWAQTLRDQGRSVSWLADQLGTARTYLSAIASGKRHASPELTARITLLLNGHEIPDHERLRREAALRVRWKDVHDQALRLAAAIARALGPDSE